MSEPAHGPGDRPARILAVSEAQIPSAVLGVNAVFAHLARLGSCELRARSSIDLDPAEIAWADAVVLVRGAAPAERRILGEAQRLGRRVATYMDDDLERVPPEARSGYFFNSRVVRQAVAFIVEHADAVLCPSERLASELARRHGRSPTVVLQPRPPRQPGELAAPHTRFGAGPGDAPVPNRAVRRPDAEAVRIGFLGSVDHEGFLAELLAGPLRRLVRERPGRVELVFCGAIPRVARELGAHCAPFQADFAEWRRAAIDLRVEVGLGPLRDTHFNRCKYFNKYLEYASLGIAGVYSRVPPNVDVVRDGETGVLCPNEPDAWFEALRILVDEPARRLRIGAAAARDAEERFSEAALEGHWREVLAPLLAHRAPVAGPHAVRLPRGRLRWALDRYAVYGPFRFAERAVGRFTGRLRPG